MLLELAQVNFGCWLYVVQPPQKSGLLDGWSVQLSRQVASKTNGFVDEPSESKTKETFFNGFEEKKKIGGHGSAFCSIHDDV